MEPNRRKAENAREAGVSVVALAKVAAVMPFEAESFDLIVCQAAFKNFVHPASALDEMHRVLRSGGTAVIQDMSHDASHADIELEVQKMQLGWWSSFITKATLEMLRRRAYSPVRFERLAGESPFGTCKIKKDGIGLDVSLHKAIWSMSINRWQLIDVDQRACWRWPSSSYSPKLLCIRTR